MLGNLFVFALAGSIFGALLADITGLNREVCFVLSSTFYKTFLPSVAGVAFLAGVSLGQGSRPLAANETPSYSGWSRYWRKVRRPILRGGVLALLTLPWSLYYVPVALTYLARTAIDEEQTIERVHKPRRSGTFCELYVYFEVRDGRSRRVCVQRGQRSVFDEYPAEDFRAGDRVRVIGRKTTLGSVVDRVQGH